MAVARGGSAACARGVTPPPPHLSSTPSSWRARARGRAPARHPSPEHLRVLRAGLACALCHHAAGEWVCWRGCASLRATVGRAGGDVGLGSVATGSRSHPHPASDRGARACARTWARPPRAQFAQYGSVCRGGGSGPVWGGRRPPVACARSVSPARVATVWCCRARARAPISRHPARSMQARNPEPPGLQSLARARRVAVTPGAAWRGCCVSHAAPRLLLTPSFAHSPPPPRNRT
jgi:hypothetical protein